MVDSTEAMLLQSNIQFIKQIKKAKLTGNEHIKPVYDKAVKLVRKKAFTFLFVKEVENLKDALDLSKWQDKNTDTAIQRLSIVQDNIQTLFEDVDSMYTVISAIETIYGDIASELKVMQCDMLMTTSRSKLRNIGGYITALEKIKGIIEDADLDM